MTRWSSRIDAIKPLRRNIDKILAALKEISNKESFEELVRLEAESIVNKIDYKFICCVCAWYEILIKVNMASKALQSIQSDVQAAVTSLASVKQFLDDFSETGYEKVIEDANEMCEKLEIEPEFTVNRKRRADQRPDVPEEQFQRIFSSIIEKATDSIVERFESLKKC